jgi:hypothetical protein
LSPNLRDPIQLKIRSNLPRLKLKFWVYSLNKTILTFQGPTWNQKQNKTKQNFTALWQDKPTKKQQDSKSWEQRRKEDLKKQFMKKME